MYVRISLVMIVMSLTLPACQMGSVDPAGSRDNLAEGAAPDEAEAGGETGGEGTAAPAEPVAPAPETVTTACDAGVWTGDYAVRSQADLDALAGYTEVTGTLLFASEDIVHLSGLACLTRVGGDLRFVNNLELQTVTAFENLYSVGGRIVFFDNRNLDAIGGFGELRSAGGLRFSENGSMPAASSVFVIDGFAKLRTVNGDVSFGDNTHRVLGFDELELITGGIIGYQSHGVDIQGMNTLSTVGNLRFTEAGDVALDGLTDLERVLGDVRVDGGTHTVRLTGLTDLSFIGGSLVFDELSLRAPLVVDLPDLEHIGGSLIVKDSTGIDLGAFSELEYIGDSLVLHESAVRNLVGFDELDVIEGDLRVVAAPLERLEGFDDLTSIGGNFFLELGVFMTDLPAFDDLVTIGGNFDLIENYALASISGFGDLESVGGNFNLFGNEQLQALGFDELDALGGGSLSIQYNTALSTCEADDLLDRLQANGFAGSATIQGNGPCQ
jgi:hypothetical protein